MAQPTKWPGPTRHARARSHPGHNVGLGRQSTVARSPAWAAEWPASSPPSALIRRSPGLFARTKPGVAAGNPRTLASFLSPFPFFPPNGAAAAERWRWPPATARRWLRRLRCESPAGQPIYLPPLLLYSSVAHGPAMEGAVAVHDGGLEVPSRRCRWAFRQRARSPVAEQAAAE